MYIASWSGGKDSCLACYLAIKKGMKVSHLVHFDRPNNLHGVDPSLIRLQAELAGIPMIQKQVESTDFEREFRATVGGLAQSGARGMVFGDIYLEPHKEWVDRTCTELGMEPVEPLWGRSSEDIVRQFVDLGFETIVASGDRKLIDGRFIGRKMDERVHRAPAVQKARCLRRERRVSHLCHVGPAVYRKDRDRRVRGHEQGRILVP